MELFSTLLRPQLAYTNKLKGQTENDLDKRGSLLEVPYNRKKVQQYNRRKGRTSNIREPMNSFLFHLSCPSHSPLWLTLCKEAFFSLPADRGSSHDGGITASYFSFHPCFSLSLWQGQPFTGHQMSEFLKALYPRSSYTLPQRSHSCPQLKSPSPLRGFTNLFSITDQSPSSRPVYPNAYLASTLRYLRGI